MSRNILAFILAFLFTVEWCPAQALRTIPVGMGLGHMVHGAGNPPLRLSNDAMAIVSEGSTEGTGIPDDQIVIVTGFEAGSSLTTSLVSLYTALGVYGDLSPTLVSLGAARLLYYDRGGPAFVVVSGAGTSNTVTLAAIRPGDSFDIDSQPPAVLDSQSVVWASRGPDQAIGTADDRIGFAFGLGTSTSFVDSIAAPGALGGEVFAVSSTRAVARFLGADGVAGTIDDELLLIDRLPHTVTFSRFVLRTGVSVFASSGGPLLVGKDTLVYPTAGVGRTSLYTVVTRALSRPPTVEEVGDLKELPAGASFSPTPVALDRDHFAYFNAGSNRVFHNPDDEVRVVRIGQRLTTVTHTPGFGLGCSDTQIPPVALGGGRVVFVSNGQDWATGTADDGVVVAQGLVTATPTFTLVPTGVQALAITAVNPRAVAMEAVDSTFTLVQGLGTQAPSVTQFVVAVPSPGSFIRLNDWTLAGSVPQLSDPGSLLDDVMTVQFPFVELIGRAQTCASGSPLAIGSGPAPLLGSLWPATLQGATPALPVALVLGWYVGDVALNPQARFYLDYAGLAETHVVTADGTGQAVVWLDIAAIPAMAGHSFCGQWGMFDPLGYNGLCVSSGFRVHL